MWDGDAVVNTVTRPQQRVYSGEGDIIVGYIYINH